jgi:uncharacterized membrane protein YesL
MPTVGATPRVLWMALVTLYDDFLPSVRVNVVWLVTAAPWAFASWSFLVLVVPASGASTQPTWPAFVAVLLALLLPTPGALVPAVLARRMAHPIESIETPSGPTFAATWRRALSLALVGYLVLAMLIGNLHFYTTVLGGWWGLVGILWAYALILWVSMHLYVAPLAVHLERPRLIDVYRQSAILSLAHPLLTFTLTVATTVLAVVMLALTPVAVLFGATYLSLVRQLALQTLVARHTNRPPGTRGE